MSSGTALVVGAFFFVPMFVAMRRTAPRELALPGVPERLLSGVMSGLRYVRHSAPMRALVVRNLAFSVCASAFWALLPVIARDQLGLGAGGFGLLSASFGIGAIVGAISIPGLLHRQSMNRVVTSGVQLWAVATLLVALTGITALALVGAFCAGMAWVYVFASLSAGTQSSAPAWVRARAVSMNLVATQGCLAIGSAVWGALASGVGTQWALGASAAAVIVLQWVYRRVRVEMGQEADVVPGVRLPELAIAAEPLPDDGPVLIQLEYRIDPDQRDAFLKAIQKRRTDAPAQRRDELARVSRSRRGGPVRRALRHRVVGGIRAAARAHDDGGQPVAAARCRAAACRRADSRLAADRPHAGERIVRTMTRHARRSRRADPATSSTCR